MGGLRVPIATYRLQFNREFRFQDARAIISYLHRLGISGIYASPVLKARSGSSHGYDVTDPRRLNPELGRETDFRALVHELQDNHMGLLLDIVPNHMAASPEAAWWMDFLENGLFSPYADFFDIDRSTGSNKVVLPFLSSSCVKAIRNGELILKLDIDGFYLYYQDYKLPLDIKSYKLVFSSLLEKLDSNGRHSRDLKGLVDVLERLPPLSGRKPGNPGEEYRRRQAAKRKFLHLVKTSPEIKSFLQRSTARFNQGKGNIDSLTLFKDLLQHQAYRLAFWKTAIEHLNYRRFFDISDLVGVRVEDPRVFEATHVLILRLIREGGVTGVRIDHIDGLYDPSQYLSRLQQEIARGQGDSGPPGEFYIIVEKILSGDESLPEEWPIDGTTGYDFLNTVNALFVSSKGSEALGRTYSRLTGSPAFADVVYRKKRQVIASLFPGEMKRLGRYLAQLARQDSQVSVVAQASLTEALAEITACLPVYRTYTRNGEVSFKDRRYLETAFREARWRSPSLEKTALELLRRVLTLEFSPAASAEEKEVWLRFVSRWQQLTGAIAAKGFEDTALYVYNRLLSLNEVGGNPGLSGLSLDGFHYRNQQRRQRWPNTLNATATHDTKRSEDVRARINVLSEIHHEWERHLTLWSQWNRPKKRVIKGLPVPEPDTEILLYQTLLGAWPLDQGKVAEFKERLSAYAIKAAREAKVFTSWLSPDRGYEKSLLAFIECILEDSAKNEFLRDFLSFERKIAYYGALNSLSQILLKITSPGVPDFYQGTELWDFSLVDPDNRRPVDFKKRSGLLDEIISAEGRGGPAPVQELLERWYDGRIKLYVIYRALGLRGALSDVFQRGDYIPLYASGPGREHICAYARRLGKQWVLTAVPRLVTGLLQVDAVSWRGGAWDNDRLLLPAGATERWVNVFTGEKLNVRQQERWLPVSEILGRFPVALLKSI